MRSPVREFRMHLAQALTEWSNAGGPVEDVTDLIEGLISVKVDEMLQAREDNRRAGSASAPKERASVSVLGALLVGWRLQGSMCWSDGC